GKILIMSSSSLMQDASNLIISWNSHAHNYERRLGGSTHAVAAHLVSLLTPSLPPKGLVLDNACGTGAFTRALLKSSADDVRVRAVDGSPGMIEIMQSIVQEERWQGRVEAEVMDGLNLKFPDETFDVSVTSFGIFFFPDPAKGAREVYRTLKPTGTAAVTCWKEIAFVPIFYEVQKLVEPAKPMAMQLLERWMKKETLEETMTAGGFTDVKVEVQEVMLVQDDLDEMVENLTIHLKDMVGKEWSEEERGRIGDVTGRVMREQRERFIVESNGKVGLKMVAWIALGRKNAS
ncbi:MAG: hypothetical protein Q9187_004198, partial [Circinaria calcarea]